MKFEDRPEARFGEKAERIVTEVLKGRGYYVTRTSYARDPKDPGGARLGGDGSPIVIPDIQASRGGATWWVEVKGKSKDVWYQKGQEWRQGIEEVYFHHYLKAQEVTGMVGELAFLVVDAAGGDGYSVLRTAPLDILDMHAHPGMDGSAKFFNGNRPVFWPVDLFKSFTIRQDELRPIAPKTAHPWGNKPKRGPAARQGYFSWEPPGIKSACFYCGRDTATCTVTEGSVTWDCGCRRGR